MRRRIIPGVCDFCAQPNGAGHECRHEDVAAVRAARKADPRRRTVLRSTAVRLIEGFLARVKEVNARSAGYAVRVARVELYGSMLTDAPRVGDVDLFVILVRKSDKAYDQRRAWLQVLGAPYRNTVEWAMLPTIEVIQLLRNRSGYISIHDEFDWTQLNTPRVLLYERERLEKLYGRATPGLQSSIDAWRRLDPPMVLRDWR